MWQSTDGGTTWSKQGLEVGIPNASVFDIQINPTTDSTIAFTYGRGAYRLVTVATTVQPPTDLRVMSVTGSNVTLSFQAPTDSLTPTGYVLEGGATPGQVLGSLPIDAAATRLTFQAPTGAFYVRMHTLAGGLRSAASNEVRLFVNVPALPAAPTNVLSLVDGNTLSLAWMNNASGGALDEAAPGRARTAEHLPADPRHREHLVSERSSRHVLDLGSRGQRERRRSELQPSGRDRAWHMHRHPGCTDEFQCGENRKHDFALVGPTRQRSCAHQFRRQRERRLRWQFPYQRNAVCPGAWDRVPTRSA